jgi:hypothetical protein
MDSQQQEKVTTALAAVEPLNSPANLPATTQPRGKLVFRLQLPQDKGDLVTNYRPDVEDDRVEVSRAMSPCDNNLDVHVGKTIRVVGVLLNMAEFESQEVKGETTEKVYASIVLEDGTIIGTTGKAVMGQLCFLIGASAPGPFNPPVEFEVRSHKVAPPKKPYYSLRRVRPSQRQGKKGVA